MYAQSDVQRNRQFYLGNKLPYDDFDAYWNQSPLKYIKNAKTPTMIHVVEGDPRVPSPQSIELHMALKQLGVPTELFMYPGNTHGIPDPRNQLVKSVERDGVDGLLRARHGQEVRVARRAQDARRRRRSPEGLDRFPAETLRKGDQSAKAGLHKAQKIRPRGQPRPIRSRLEVGRGT